MDVIMDIKLILNGYIKRILNVELMDMKDHIMDTQWIRRQKDTMMVGPVMPPRTFEVSNGQKNPSFEDLSLSKEV